MYLILIVCNTYFPGIRMTLKYRCPTGALNLIINTLIFQVVSIQLNSISMLDNSKLQSLVIWYSKVIALEIQYSWVVGLVIRYS